MQLRRMIISGAAATAVALALAAPASAHTEVKSTSPGSRRDREHVDRRGDRHVHPGDPERHAEGDRRRRHHGLQGLRWPRPAQGHAAARRAEAARCGQAATRSAGRSRRSTATSRTARSASGSASRAAPLHRSRSPRSASVAVAAPAAAHVQVAPAEAAPGDPVKFERARPGRDGGAHGRGRAAGPEGRAAVLVRGPARLEAHDRAADDGSVGVDPLARRGSRPTASSGSRSSPRRPSRRASSSGRRSRRYDDGDGGRLDRPARLREPGRR